MYKKVEVNDIKISNDNPISLIIGPCQIENKEITFEIAKNISDICKSQNMNFIFKSSFDKANRSSISGERGVGIKKGLEILSEIKNQINCPIITDVHKPEDCLEVSKIVDIIQIPAFLCRQTDLILAAAETNLPINVKKGQFLSPWEMENIIKKINSKGNFKVLLCERGVSFGYNNLVVDMRSLKVLKDTKYPVVMDVTHSLQYPGSLDHSSGGDNKYISTLSRASTAVGISAIFIETHLDPATAPSDGKVMLKLNDLENLIQQIKAIDNVVKNF